MSAKKSQAPKCSATSNRLRLERELKRLLAACVKPFPVPSPRRRISE